MRPILFTILLLKFLHVVQNHNILGIFPLQSTSHYVMFERLLKTLAAEGHDVDVISHFPQQEKIPRYNDLVLEVDVIRFVNNLPLSIVEDMTRFDMMRDMTELCGVEICKAFFNSTTLNKLKNTTKKYDLLITEIFGSDCMLGFSHLFNIPVIALTSSVNLPWASDRFGNPDNPSYIPNYYISYSSKMTVVQRLINVFFLVMSKISYEIFSMRPSNTLAREFFGADMPDLDDLAYNTSLLLVNSHFSINQARPTVPNFIEVGGLHINDPQPLSDHFEKLLQKESNIKGTIYVSMGSMLLSETFDGEKLQAMLDVFSILPYKVIWKAVRKKIAKDLVIPSNVHFEKWMPQLGILCHPNVKLFITHGGLMGSQEAIYCGVPSIGIPFFGDQQLNVHHSEALGIGAIIQYNEINNSRFLKIIKQVLEDPTYEINAKRMSNLFKDRPQTPLETAVYWVNYVIRHKGAPQLRSEGASLSWYQYYLVDVALILLGGILLIVYLVRFILTACVNILHSRTRRKEKRN